MTDENKDNYHDTLRFLSVTEKQCRHPIPPYYTILVEIMADRTTKARKIVCDSNNPKLTKCPPGYNNGEVYYHRTLNEGCQEMCINSASAAC
ncbi:DgyrCDS6845 [Dimorphilus gyrociliatus]|uniref:DgyrCDS6845 n=1 Tax=Dimorphilus gyrociliatus TaxID=2664684 RepID=A0A7I8VRI1_9ANNE|nr:DgyrCDS6845 [Dimorphilus gyrociliatus]